MAVVAGSVTLADPSNGWHRTTGLYSIEERPPSGEQREWEDVTAPGSDGAEIKDHGFRSRRIGPFTGYIVNTTKAYVFTALTAIRTALENQAAGVSVAYGGETYPSCYLDEGSPSPEGVVEYPADAGRYILRFSLSFTQRRAT